jgi:hypothetical protein
LKAEWGFGVLCCTPIKIFFGRANGGTRPNYAQPYHEARLRAREIRPLINSTDCNATNCGASNKYLFQSRLGS